MMNREVTTSISIAPMAVPPAPSIAQNVDMRCFTIVSEGRTFGLPVEAIHTVFEIVAVTAVPSRALPHSRSRQPAGKDRDGRQPSTAPAS